MNIAFVIRKKERNFIRGERYNIRRDFWFSNYVFILPEKE